MIPEAKRPGFFVLWGIPFVVVGLYLIIGRFFVDAYIRSTIYYAISDSRLLILREGAIGSVQTFQLRQLPEASFNNSPSGRGTLDLSGASVMPDRTFGGWTPALAKGARLLKIENAWQVFILLQQAQRQASAAGTQTI